MHKRELNGRSGNNLFLDSKSNGEMLRPVVLVTYLD
jgi:hypothetical protein